MPGFDCLTNRRGFIPEQEIDRLLDECMGCELSWRKLEFLGHEQSVTDGQPGNSGSELGAGIEGNLTDTEAREIIDGKSGGDIIPKCGLLKIIWCALGQTRSTDQIHGVAPVMEEPDQITRHVSLSGTVRTISLKDDVIGSTVREELFEPHQRSKLRTFDVDLDQRGMLELRAHDDVVEANTWNLHPFTIGVHGAERRCALYEDRAGPFHGRNMSDLMIVHAVSFEVCLQERDIRRKRLHVETAGAGGHRDRDRERADVGTDVDEV
jgi:hypothetical protein